MIVAHMIEHSVENQPHFAPFQFPNQLLQRLLTTKLRVDGEKVGGVILVI